MWELVGLAVGSLVVRPYVFLFLVACLVGAVGEWGWRRALAFVGLAGGIALAAEFASTRIGIPFGAYHYTGATRGRELYLANVPFFDPLSFSFLAYASLGLARRLRPAAGRGALAVTAGLLMMWLDLVIDPLAVRGDRWFLGRIFYYPDPGWYFGVPAANFLGWSGVGTAIVAVWLVLEPRLGGLPPAWAARLPGRASYPVCLYYGVLVFNLVVTAAIGETRLFWAGMAAHLPLAALVVFFETARRRWLVELHPGRAGQPA